MFHRKTLSHTENLELWVEKEPMNIKTESVMFLCEGFCQSAHVLCREGIMPVSSCILLIYSHRGACDRVTAGKPGVSQGPWSLHNRDFLALCSLEVSSYKMS